MNIDDADDSTTDEDDGFIFGESVGGSKLELQPVPIKASETAEERRRKESPT